MEINTVFSPRTYIAKVMAQTGVHPKYYNYEDMQYDEETDTYYYQEDDMSAQEARLGATVLALYDYSVKASAYFG